MFWAIAILIGFGSTIFGMIFVWTLLEEKFNNIIIKTILFGLIFVGIPTLIYNNFEIYLIIICAPFVIIAGILGLNDDQMPKTSWNSPMDRAGPNGTNSYMAKMTKARKGK